MAIRESEPGRRELPETDEWGRPIQELKPVRVSASPVLVAAFAIVGGIMIARFVTTASAYFVIAAILATILGLALARNMQFGIIMYFWIAALSFGESPGVQSPNSGYDAGLMPSEVLIIFMTFVWVATSVFGSGLKLARSPMNTPMICLAATSLVSMVMSNILSNTRDLLFHQMLITQVAEVGLLACSVFAFFAVANNLKEAKWIKRIFLPVVLLGLYFSELEVIGIRLPVPVFWGQFLVGAAIAFLLSRVFFDELSRRKKVVFTILALYLTFASFCDLSWVSGWIAVGTMIAVVAIFRSRAFFFAMAAIALFVLFIYPGIYYGIATESEQGGDYDRFTIWHDAFGMFMSVDPVFGVGPGNYYPYILYHSTIWYGRGTYTTAHSNILQIGAELGLLGLAVLLWVVISAVVTGVWAARASPPDLKWLPIAATATFLGVFVASTFGDYLLPSRGNNGIVHFGTTVYPWLIMGACVATANLPKKHE